MHRGYALLEARNKQAVANVEERIKARAYTIAVWRIIYTC